VDCHSIKHFYITVSSNSVSMYVTETIFPL